MKGTSFDEQLQWRIELTNELKDACEKYGVAMPKIINPPLRYNYVVQMHDTEREVFTWELRQVQKSDVLVVNLAEINDSCGSHFEIATALSSPKKPFIIGYGTKKQYDECHPWIKCSIIKYYDNIEDLADYVADYLL